MSKKEKKMKEKKVKDTATHEPKVKKRRRRFGDRNDGRKLRTIPPMNKLMPYIMAKRSDAQNTFADSIEVTKTDAFCRARVKEGMTNFGFLHVLLAAYVRMLSQYPAANRFVNGQKIFARNEIEIVMTIKKHMKLESPDTCIKVKFEPTDTVCDVYKKFNDVVQANVGNDDESSFDVLAKVLNFIPGLLLRWTVKLLFALDYWGLLPRWLTKLSPFHGSMIVTSMGSLGIKPIYHHIYDFGNLPVFLSYGVKRTVSVIERDGSIVKKRYIDLKAVTDERICDGYYFASAFKAFKSYIEKPEQLLTPPENVLEDID